MSGCGVALATDVPKSFPGSAALLPPINNTCISALETRNKFVVNFIARRTTVPKHLSLCSHGNAALFLVSSPMQLNGYSPSRRANTRYEVAVPGSLSSCLCLRFPQLPPLAFVDINSHAADNPSHEVSFLKSDLTALSIVMDYDRSILYPTDTMVGCDNVRKTRTVVERHLYPIWNMRLVSIKCITRKY